MESNNYLNFHCHKKRSSENEIVSYRWPDRPKEPQLLHSVGIHPWDTLEESDPRELNSLFKHIEQYPSAMVGETGLDRLKGASMEGQKKLFLEHIEISSKMNRPLIIHCVKALEEIIGLRKKSKTKNPWVIHDFNGNSEQIKQCRNLNISFSIGKKIFENTKISKSIKSIPLDALFLETDDQLDYSIQEIYSQASRLYNIELEELSYQIEKNFEILLASTGMMR